MGPLDGPIREDTYTKTIKTGEFQKNPALACQPPKSLNETLIGTAVLIRLRQSAYW